MSRPKYSHACFLPANYRELPMQYQADYERGVEDRNRGNLTEEGQKTVNERVAEGEQKAKTEWPWTQSG